MVISLLNGKGGVGKSTVAVNLAAALQAGGASVLLIDTDKQGSTSDWSLVRQEAGRRQPVEVVQITQPTLETNLPPYRSRYDYVVVDGAAKFDRMDVSAMRVSDVALVCVRPSYADLWGAHDLLEHIRDERKHRRKLKAAFLVVMDRPTTRMSKEIGAACEELKLPVLRSRTGMRAVYVDAFSDGESVIERKPSSKAAQEIRSLTDEIRAL